MMMQRHHISPRFFITGWVGGREGGREGRREGALGWRMEDAKGPATLLRSIIRKRSYCSSGSTEPINCVCAYKMMTGGERKGCEG